MNSHAIWMQESQMGLSVDGNLGGPVNHRDCVITQIFVYYHFQIFYASVKALNPRPDNQALWRHWLGC